MECVVFVWTQQNENKGQKEDNKSLYYKMHMQKKKFKNLSYPQIFVFRKPNKFIEHKT